MSAIGALHVGARPPQLLTGVLVPDFMRNPDLQIGCHPDTAEDFFANGDGERYPPEVFQTCNTCPVQQACLQWALDSGERWGVWGGLTPLQRSRLADAKPTNRRCRNCEQRKQLHARGLCSACHRRRVA